MFAKPKSPLFIDSVVFELEKDNSSTPIRAVLRDEKGIVMSSIDAIVPEGQKNFKWNGLNDLPYGIYVLEMGEGEQETRIRMVKRV
ncbi:MAG: hypothetical protein ACO29O_00125 [Chitinophagaceae bacterium]